MSRRAFVVVVVDACVVGALPGAAAYGDAGANTFEPVAQAGGDAPGLPGAAFTLG